MTRPTDSVWKTDMNRELSSVLCDITDEQVMQNFLRDVMTEKEIIEIAARFKAAGMLSAGKKYTEVIAETKLSSRTIARISDWLQRGSNGYAPALEKAALHHDHTPPARD